MKNRRRETLEELHQRSLKLEGSFIDMSLDHKLSPIFVDEFLSSIRAFSKKVAFMKSTDLAESEDFWEEGNFAMGKLNRLLASLRLLGLTEKLDPEFLMEAKQEVLSLQKEMHQLIRSLG